MNNIDYALRDAIKNACEYARKLSDETMEIIRLMRCGSEGIAFGRMSYLWEGVGWEIEVVTLVKGLRGKADESLERTSGVLLALQEAQKNMDCVLICDLLEYELLPVIRNWENDLTECMGET